MAAYSLDLRERIVEAVERQVGSKREIARWLVWLDNVQFHSAPKAVAAIEATGARVCYLPTYSPDCNPLEAGISKIKEHLRTAKTRTPRTLTTALAQALVG
jgi:transposase